ncbi:hypothetical protein BLNAU_17920 [Blattamonas nauphoetae]|uniref:Uncharacterized protein n=1 Tax=Blattamonas nauphoetae TaxID=2049346 RepID=A0ABQ9X5U6_9EUKA|nr:hypothetical protein BLNAU_17920 [Blattamonas nauphoetae]
MVHLDQLIIHVEIPVLFGKGNIWLLFLFFQYFVCALLSTYELIFLIRDRQKKNGLLIALFACLSAYLAIHSILNLTPFPWTPTSFFLFDQMPRALLNCAWILFGWWLSQLLLSQKRLKQFMAVLHIVFLLIAGISHFLGMLISLALYKPDKQLTDPGVGSTKSLHTSFFSLIIIYSVVLVMLSVDYVVLFWARHKVKDKTIRRFHSLYLFPMTSIIVVLLLQIGAFMIIVLQVGVIYGSMENQAKICLYPQIYGQKKPHDCTNFAWLYVLRYTLLHTLPVIVFFVHTLPSTGSSFDRVQQFRRLITHHLPRPQKFNGNDRPQKQNFRRPQKNLNGRHFCALHTSKPDSDPKHLPQDHTVLPINENEFEFDEDAEIQSAVDGNGMSFYQNNPYAMYGLSQEEESDDGEYDEIDLDAF